MNGVFAVNKPSGPTSAAIVNQLKERFIKSKAFEGDIKKAKKARFNKKNKYNKSIQPIKIGHGGTLDPLADGVLVIGVGSGTKKLQDYLGKCTKTYRATALLGSCTTTYDSQGKVFHSSAVDHLKNLQKDDLANKLKQFQGDIKQIPPVFSALKMDGMRLYDYAYSGKPLPREIEARDVRIDSIELLSDGLVWDQTEYKQPTEVADEKEVEFAHNVSRISHAELPTNEPINHDKTYPTIEIQFTVSSGTYIRTLIHDIGLALGTTAHMVKLTRLQQGQWILGKNVLEVDSIVDKEEDEWIGLLKKMLESDGKITVSDAAAVNTESKVLTESGNNDKKSINDDEKNGNDHKDHASQNL